MILEGIVTSLNSNGQLNVAPMGPIVDESLTTLLLRPFQSSTTWRNLRDTRCGVFHVTDDAGLIARAALNLTDAIPETFPATQIEGNVLADACRWYEFVIDAIDDSTERAECQARVVHSGRLRDFFGFHRARHAILEAAIIATRTHLLDEQTVLAELDRLRTPVAKTGRPADTDAFDLIRRFVVEQYQPEPCAKPS